MTQNREQLKTGMKGLDLDLKELFDICESERLNSIKQTIANNKLSSEDFSKIVPNSLVRLSATLMGPGFDMLSEEVNKDSIPLLKEAKSLIEKHFRNLFKHKASRIILSEEAKKIVEKGREPEEEFLRDKIILGFTYTCAWLGRPPELTPGVHIGFKNRKGKVLLDSRPDWDDLSYLLESLARILAELLERGKSLAKSEQINLSDAEKVGERIGKTLEHFRKIQELAPSYKIKIKTKRRKTKESSQQE